MSQADDLTTERAAIIGQHYACEDSWYSCPLAEDGCANPGEGEECTCGVDTRRTLLDKLLKTARQEALREARDYALACVAERNKQAFELTKTVLNDPRAVWLGCKASEAERIAEWIDRLASEGG